jgi:hypothetical protein
MSQRASLKITRSITVVMGPGGKWYFSDGHTHSPDWTPISHEHGWSIADAIAYYGQDKLVETPQSVEPLWLYDVYLALGMV